ncbi:MAG TPA: phospholipid carrier-dependent glycosyltransferase [Desulfobacterales bacterium]|nr:phospholipid carrier-dependent glycosyltransferase [Desulfobacterales bacterium]HIP38280.1 phospholipid carrier-dependent glycosyltransferase [Desulfocapsa sulfexigens]
MNNKSLSFLLLGIFVLLYLLPLGARPLFIPDETRYAEVPREMIVSGDWVVPHINGLRYFEKPVLGYWISAVSIMVFGENDFAVRLPSAMACGFVALLIMLVCRSSCEMDSSAPALATLVYLTSFGVVVMGGIAVLDNVLTLFVTACLITFFLATRQQPKSNKEHLFLFLAGLFAGAAFLTKGFIAFAVPVLTAAPYLVWQKKMV